MMDFTNAVVVTPHPLAGPPDKAVAMLILEAAKRTQVAWRRSDSWPEPGVPVIAVGLAGSFTGPYAETVVAHAPGKPEGYRIRTITDREAHAILVAGNDARGVLFGVGRLLRELRMSRGQATLPGPLDMDTAPRYALRGHQLGYRPKTNSYDGWDPRQWEQYIRDLAVFGTNAIELIPPRSDDEPDSPLFPLPPMTTMIGVSRLADEYGLDVWIWYPAMDKDYSDPKTVEAALAEWGEVFQKLPRVDAVFVPGGDPGHTEPKTLLAILEKQTENLHRYHPRAQMWVSPQGFNKEWMDQFLGLLKHEPAWLSGVVYGPQVRMPIAAFRAAVPKRYPIRHYPDITHCHHCEYPVPDWDVAFALTEGREPINPRPVGEATIFRDTQKETVGFLTYSEGCNDDVNKVVWCGLGWDPEQDVTQILREYSRYFIGPELEEGFAQGLLALERDWQGTAISNDSIYTTLHQFQDMERSAAPPQLLNWRFQQALYRAYYDAYVRARMLHESGLEDQALSRLREAPRIGALNAMAQAEEMLNRGLTEPVAADWRARIFELAEALFQSIRMQLSVSRYKAEPGRADNLDYVDFPITQRAWLLQRMAEIRRYPGEPERLRQIEVLLQRENPGPGGFYDALGYPGRRPHLLPGKGFSQDPGTFESVQTIVDDEPQGPKAWWSHAMALYDLPLRTRYTDLDPHAEYKVRVVYGSGPIRMEAFGREIHPLINRPYQLLEYDLPPESTRGGTLELTWHGPKGQGHAGRGCQVAEVWLIRR